MLRALRADECRLLRLWLWLGLCSVWICQIRTDRRTADNGQRTELTALLACLLVVFAGLIIK